MNSFKRITAIMMTVAIVFQLAALQGSATAAQAEPAGNGKTVSIRIVKGIEDTSDFVGAFPEDLFMSGAVEENPLKQPAAQSRTEYEEMPGYYQTYYSDILYGTGTVDTCGSSIVALAMMATFLTGYDYTPDVLARWFAAKATDDAARLQYACDALDLPYETSTDWEETFDQLQDGKYVILQMDATSMFSQSQHFIVLKGMTEEGKILVNDPKLTNFINETLKEKYLTGFEETDISTGFCSAWIFDKSKVPEDISCYTDSCDIGSDSRYEDLNLTPAEKQLLARVVCTKGYGECEEGQQMMLEVILNRLLSEDFADSLKEIVYGEKPLCDTDALNKADVTWQQYLVVEKALSGPYLLGADVTEFSYICHQ